MRSHTTNPTVVKELRELLANWATDYASDRALLLIAGMVLHLCKAPASHYLPLNLE